MALTDLNKDRKIRRKTTADINPLFYGKLQPQAKELEEAILGAIMLEKSAFDTVIEILKPECFYVDAHQKIFRAMQDLTGRGMPIDLLTVVEQLKVNEELEAIGGCEGRQGASTRDRLESQRPSIVSYIRPETPPKPGRCAASAPIAARICSPAASARAG